MGATLTGGAKIAWQKFKFLFTISSTSILGLIQPLTAKLHQHSALI